jgi:hypothetical protein
MAAMSQNRTKAEASLPRTAFKKGQSGNPGGRPKLPEEFKALAKRASIDALRRVAEIVKDAEAKHSDVIRAAEFLADRAWGKATQDVNVGGQLDNPVRTKIDTSGMSSEEKILFAGLLAKGLTKNEAEPGEPDG